jgi:uncharacterized protein (TIGR03437 family)
MKNRVLLVPGFLLLLGASLVCPAARAQTVRFQTNFGAINVTLLPESAPGTVDNFLKYVNRGSFTNSFFHRSVPGFIIQGGGYQFDTSPKAIPADAPIQNEFQISNTRGTLAMAKLGTSPNSATTQWFFNLANNSGNLDNQNGGFSVFGRVASAAGLAIIDKMAAAPVYDAGSPFDQLPLQNYKGGTITLANLVLVSSITVLSAGPVISDNGVISASSFGGFASAAAGSYIEIYGSNLASTTRGWKSGDFIDGHAPTTLDGVTVTVDGQPAFVNFVSPAQVNVQAPAGITAGGTDPVVVTYAGRSSPPAMLAIQETAGGLLAPPAFNVNGVQYVEALHQSTGMFVSNGSIPNTAAAPAASGETLVFYGIGLGPVTPGPVAGQIATGTTAVTASVQFQFGGAQAQVLYAGLAPGLVGVYQFNVVAPAGIPSGDVPLQMLVNGEPLSQTLFVPMQ